MNCYLAFPVLRTSTSSQNPPLTKERDLGWASTSKLPFSWFLYKLLRPNPKLERALERHSLEVDKSKFLKE
jgi:hypothetical protein